MKQFRTIEAELIPSGSFTSVEEFKQFIIDDLYHLMELKKEFEAEKEEEGPIPITIFVLFDDFSAQRVRLMPRNATEKKVLFMAIKKQIAEKSFPQSHRHSTTPVFGAFFAEVFVGSYKMTEEDKQLSEQELLNKYKQYFQENENKYTRIITQFEAIPKQLEAKVYSIIDPCILVEEAEESAKLTSTLNSEESKIDSYMSSLFDFSVEQEMDVMGREVNFKLEQVDVVSAVDEIRNVLKS
jgi:hypothetical protein